MRNKDICTIVDEAFADALYHQLVNSGIPVLTALRDDFSKLNPQEVKNALSAFGHTWRYCFRNKRKVLRTRIANQGSHPYALSEEQRQIKREAANYATEILEEAKKHFVIYYSSCR
jgi:hypothetical protein